MFLSSEPLFLITSSTLNEYLDSFLPGLTAKVWRTYNASFIFQKEIDKLTSIKKLEDFKEADVRLNFLLAIFNQANTAVALLCNHQKAVNTNLNTNIDKIDAQLKELKKKRFNKKKFYKIRKILKNGGKILYKKIIENLNEETAYRVEINIIKICDPSAPH